MSGAREGERGSGEFLFNVDSFSLGRWKIQETNGGESSTARWMYLVHWTVELNMVKTVHFILCDFCCFLVIKSCLTLLRPHGLQPARLLCPWDFPGKNTGVGFHALLQGIFPIQGSSLHLLHCSCIGRRFFTTEPPEKIWCDFCHQKKKKKKKVKERRKKGN